MTRQKQVHLSYSHTLRGKSSFLKSLNLLMPEILPLLEKTLQKYLSSSIPEITEVSLSLLICGDRKMQSVNREYRNKNKTTDVLSFPVHEDLYFLKKKQLKLLMHGPILLGDIIISKDVLLRQAKEFQLPWWEEFFHLFFHGFLHLFGLDHERSTREERLMNELEEELVKKTIIALRCFKNEKFLRYHEEITK